MKKLLNEREAAALLRMSPKTLSQWRWRKRGPSFVTIGRSIRYREEDIEKFLLSSSSVSDQKEKGSQGIAIIATSTREASAK